MMTRHERNGVTWVDLESPTHDELRAVMHEFDIDPQIEEEIRTPTPYPLVVTFPEYVYTILHFPTTNIDGGTRSQEVDIVAGKDFLITTRYELVGSILHLHKAFEAEELLGLPKRGHEIEAVLIERVIRHLYSAMRDETEQIARQLERIERDIFEGRERATVRAISEVGRILLRFDTALARHAEPLEEFLKHLTHTDFFGNRFGTMANRIKSEREHVAAIVKSYREVAHELRSTNDSLLSTSQNEVMKMFTVMTVAFLPLTFIAGIFGMHTKYGPILGLQHDFLAIIFLMVIVEVLLLLVMRLRKWI